MTSGVPVCHALTRSTAADKHLAGARHLMAQWTGEGDPPLDVAYPLSLRHEVAEWLADDIIGRLPETRPAFVHGFINNWLCDTWMINEIAQRMPAEVVVVPPDVLGQLAREGLRPPRNDLRSRELDPE